MAEADKLAAQAAKRECAGGPTAAAPIEAAHTPPAADEHAQEKAAAGDKTVQVEKGSETGQQDKAVEKAGQKHDDEAQAEDKGAAGQKDKARAGDEEGAPGAVVGEDEAETSRAPAAHKTVAHRAATHPPQPVMVRITSRPLGAEVRTKKQLLGRTPINIRFNPGNSYQLTFIKAGYVTSSRTIAVAGNAKAKSISVPMKKAPPPARHGLFRGR